MVKHTKIPTSYIDYTKDSVLDTQHKVKGIIVFNWFYPHLRIECHKVGYDTQRRHDAIGVWRVKPKVMP